MPALPGDASREMHSKQSEVTEEDIEQFNKDGYLVFPDFASAQELQDMKARAEQLVDEFDPSTLSVFSTKNQKTTTDNYFMDSAGNISFFFEEKAFDEQGNLRQPKALSINKIGHAMHDLDPVFRKFSRSSKMATLMAKLGFKRPLPVQSMYIFKQPKIGGEVVPHQDSSFLYTDPPSCVGIWLALEDATVRNGCLWTLPGEHHAGLRRRFITGKDGKVTFDADAPTYDLSKFVPLEVPAGTLVVLHGCNVHYSNENTSDVSRHAYSMHTIEGVEGFNYPSENWLQRQSGTQFEPL